MTIANTIAGAISGFGSCTFGAVQSNNNTQTGTGTITVPSAGVLTFNGVTYSLSKGWMRVRIYTITGTTPTFAVTMQGNDGTNLVTFAIIPVSQTMAANQELDYVAIFNSERSFTTFKAIITEAGTTPSASVDIEIAGNP